MKADSSANLLEVYYSGKVCVADLETSFSNIETLIAKLRPGFTIFTDLSQLDSMELGCVDHITKAMKCIGEHGVQRVVRVIPDPSKDIGFNILSLFHYPREVQILTCETIEEAKKALLGIEL